MQEMVKDWGFEVLSAVNGVEAWKLFNENPDVQLVVSDWMMPELDGVELCKLIRGQTERRYTYYLLLTAKSQNDDIVEGLEAGADDFITKPFNQPELKVRIFAGERPADGEEACWAAWDNRKIEKQAESGSGD